MTEQNDQFKPASDKQIVEENILRFVQQDNLHSRVTQSILDAVQYVEQLGAYGRGGHLQDMTIYALFSAFKAATKVIARWQVDYDEVVDRDRDILQKLEHLRKFLYTVNLDGMKGQKDFVDFRNTVFDILTGEITVQDKGVLAELAKAKEKLRQIEAAKDNIEMVQDILAIDPVIVEDDHSKLQAISRIVEELEASSVSMSLPFIKFYEQIKGALEIDNIKKADDSSAIAR